MVQKIRFDEAYISLYHHIDKENNFIIDKELSEIFKKKLLFRWYKLLNTGNNERITILWFKNDTLGDPSLNQKYLNNSIFALKIKSATTYKIKKSINKPNPSISSEINLFPLIISLARQEPDLENEGYNIVKLAKFEKENLKVKLVFMLENEM